MGRVAQSVQRLTTGWTVRGSNPGGARFLPVQTGPDSHPVSCTMGTGSFSGVKYGRGVLLTTHPFLVPWPWKSRAIPLPTLWATPRPVMGTFYLQVLFPFFNVQCLCYLPEKVFLTFLSNLCLRNEISSHFYIKMTVQFFFNSKWCLF